MTELTPSKENYIKSIFNLSQQQGSARISDIASDIGVAKSSASLAVQDLESKGLATKDKLRRVALTELGIRHAAVITDKFGIIFRFLTEVLGVSEEIAQNDACELEHVISTHTACALCGAVNKNTTTT